jgi:hypothetical protein
MCTWLSGFGWAAGAQRAVALGVGHRHAEGQVVAVDVFEIALQARVVIGAVLGIGAMGAEEQRVQRVATEVALRAAGLLAHPPHGFELVQQIGGAVGQRDHPVHRRIEPGQPGLHHRRQIRRKGHVIGPGDSSHSRRQLRRIGDGADAATVDEDGRPQSSQRFTISLGGHQHGGLRTVSRSGCIRRTTCRSRQM